MYQCVFWNILKFELLFEQKLLLFLIKNYYNITILKKRWVRNITLSVPYFIALTAYL